MREKFCDHLDRPCLLTLKVKNIQLLWLIVENFSTKMIAYPHIVLN